jgi:hypothetical protein
MKSTVVLYVIFAALTGCSVVPDKAGVELFHASHPLAGPPFGPTSEEDSLDILQGTTRWQRGRVYGEIGLGYKLKDGGFYGPDFTFTGRVGVELWSKSK